MKKFILLLCAVTAFILNVNSQVSYLKGLNKVKMNIENRDDSLFLNIRTNSVSSLINDSAEILIKLMNDSVIHLHGTSTNKFVTTKTYTVIFNLGLIIAGQNYTSFAEFPLSRAQAEAFKTGIKRIRINMTPKIHDRIWKKKDKIGKKLYEIYTTSCCGCSNSFCDNF